MNVLWLLFSVVLLGVATAVARESRQRRQSVRITKAVPSDILLPDGYMAQGITCNLSNGGVQARIHGLIHAGVGDTVRFVFPCWTGRRRCRPRSLPSRKRCCARSSTRSTYRRRGAGHDSVLARGHLVGPARDARGRPSDAQPGAHSAAVAPWSLADDRFLAGQSVEEQEEERREGRPGGERRPGPAAWSACRSFDARCAGAQAAGAGFHAAIVESSQSSAISQTVSVLRGTRFSSYRIGTGCYMVGHIPLLARATMVLTEFPWLIVLVVAIFSFPMAALIWGMVRRRARARLQGSD